MVGMIMVNDSKWLNDVKWLRVADGGQIRGT